ncbi:hypothetical protein HMN09_00229400 [Mycena chlorophos]|uniref:NADH:flavin oxidoreductase/NADH oxidase N-terminal domain-containing protein n=1 Tax=Mycena chlorophos TaxID=658473 RepID=A0A8H6TKH9_MYCCL|nr:hypothetical protein HMN09_00229400 [Mycena chlorophos]
MAPKKPPTASKPKPKSSTVRLGDAPLSASNRINPLTAFAKPKGKAKAEPEDDRLWVDIYEPSTVEELAIHPKKVEDVRRWLTEALVGGPSGKLRKYRLDDHESLFSKFENFLERAATCNTVFAGPSSSTARRRIVLLEDLPNILHAETRARFHEAFQALAASPDPDPVPVVIVVSNAGTRGEAADERLLSGHGFGRERDDALDIYTILPRDLLNGPYVTQISFNPIAPTIMKKALNSLVSAHFASQGSGTAPSKEMLDIIIETSNGDIRSAIMALQFSCIIEPPSGKRKKGSSKANARTLLEAITRREQSLVLFHLLGKVLYNKRKGDPPNPSATAKDIQRDKDLDATLKDPPKLPPHLDAHVRRTSRVDVDLLYADSPIDSSLFSLYIHQNYHQYCNEVEECDGVAEWLSWAESSGGEAWYQANPHQFHLLALGTLHSLPSPVPRRSQKSFKPQFFDFLAKEKDAWDAVREVRGWIMGVGASDREGTDPGRVLGRWSRSEVVTELGGVLKARDAGFFALFAVLVYVKLIYVYAGMSAMTRNRASGTVPNDLTKEYYVQRTAGGTGLIVTEGILVSPQGSQWPTSPGIWNDEQVAAWKTIVNAVHEAGTKIYAQLSHGAYMEHATVFLKLNQLSSVGRTAHPDAELQRVWGEVWLKLGEPRNWLTRYPPVYGPSAIAARVGGKFRFLPGSPGYVIPTPISDPRTIIAQFKQAAVNAKRAGFDGVELHGASGMLIAQFLDSGANQRTDEWGGSAANRARFALETLAALKEVWGPDVAFKISPGNGTNDVGMPVAETIEVYGHLMKEVDKLGLAYVALVRYNAKKDTLLDGRPRGTEHDVLGTYAPFLPNTNVFVNGSVTPDEAVELLGGGVDGVFFGMPFLTHPDLTRRIAERKTLDSAPRVQYLYDGAGEDGSVGYTDYVT